MLVLCRADKGPQPSHPKPAKRTGRHVVSSLNTSALHTNQYAIHFQLDIHQYIHSLKPSFSGPSVPLTGYARDLPTTRLTPQTAAAHVHVRFLKLKSQGNSNILRSFFLNRSATVSGRWTRGIRNNASSPKGDSRPVRRAATITTRTVNGTCETIPRLTSRS